MTFEERINLLERLDQLIRMGATGTPEQLAKRLGVSQRKLYRILDLMKVLRAPLVYSTSRRSYLYETPVWFHFGFYHQKLSSKASREIEGGVGFRRNAVGLPTVEGGAWFQFVSSSGLGFSGVGE